VPVAVELRALVLKLKLKSDRSQEGLEVVEEILLSNLAVEVQQVKHLPFHQINLRQCESESIIALDSRVPSPMLVLW
jgi:hypothetical protein